MRRLGNVVVWSAQRKQSKQAVVASSRTYSRFDDSTKADITRRTSIDHNFFEWIARVAVTRNNPAR